MIRIANGQGFWGDWLEAPVRLVEDGPLDYLTLDYLAEVTMSILQKQRQKDPLLGYATDFPPLMGRIAHTLKQRHVRVVANAGGVNPAACARAVRRLAPELKIAVVAGDDLLPRIDELFAAGHSFENMETGQPLAAFRPRIRSANAYLGAFPIAQALATGADVVITGRCADAALSLGPSIFEFGWRQDDLDLLAAGVAAGHIIECGAHSTGGNCLDSWQTVPEMASIGYPIIEAEPDGSFVITKHAASGGRVSEATVKEQLVYEIGDPRRYLTPDVVADFTSLHVCRSGDNRVRVTGARGTERPQKLKVSISYFHGYKATGTLTYGAPDAYQKALAADQIIRERLARLNLHFDRINSEFFGVNAVQGGVVTAATPPVEVQLRIGVRGEDRAAIERFTREMIPLVLSGPPGATGYGDGRPAVREVIAYWPALLDRSEVPVSVEIVQ